MYMHVGLFICSDAYKGSLAYYRDNRPSYHQLTCRWACPKPPVDHGIGKHCESILVFPLVQALLAILWVELSSGYQWKKPNYPDIIPENKNVLTHCLVL